MKILEELKQLSKQYENRGSIGIAAAMTVCIDRIEMSREYQETKSKLTPAKVVFVITKGELLKSLICPNCKTQLKYLYNVNNCGGCGQTLDWGA